MVAWCGVDVGHHSAACPCNLHQHVINDCIYICMIKNPSGFSLLGLFLFNILHMFFFPFLNAHVSSWHFNCTHMLVLHHTQWLLRMALCGLWSANNGASWEKSVNWMFWGMSVPSGVMGLERVCPFSSQVKKWWCYGGEEQRGGRWGQTPVLCC